MRKVRTNNVYQIKNRILELPHFWPFTILWPWTSNLRYPNLLFICKIGMILISLSLIFTELSEDQLRVMYVTSSLWTPKLLSWHLWNVLWNHTSHLSWAYTDTGSCQKLDKRLFSGFLNLRRDPVSKMALCFRIQFDSGYRHYFCFQLIRILSGSGPEKPVTHHSFCKNLFTPVRLEGQKD